MDITDYSFTRPPQARALIPFGVFLLFYFGVSLATGDFYKVPMPVAFLVASATALVMNHKASLRSKVELFAHGMGNVDIMSMCLIFILAGAFANTARMMGAVDGTVHLAIAMIPGKWLLPGLFLVGCFISLAIGTSVGTVVALAPIAMGLTQSLDVSPGLCLGVVVGGAMFGDNLSMISDTTIAATRTQGVEMREKFRANLKIALAAAVLTLVIYLFLSPKVTQPLPSDQAGSVWALLPYLSVLVLALFGVNVMAVLLVGTALAGAIGIGNGSFSAWGFLDAMGKGVLGMSETLIVALLAGGLLKVIRYNGGISYLLNAIERRIHNRQGCELGIAGLVAVVNVFTANNTVAIVVAGPIARDLSDRFGVEPKRSASILDATSCVVQGILPYGAQILAAAGIAGSTLVSPLDIMRYMFYPYLLAVCLLVAILFDFKLLFKRAKDEGK